MSTYDASTAPTSTSSRPASLIASSRLRALESNSTGQVPVKDLITRHIPLDDVLSAFDIVLNGLEPRA